MKIQEEKPKNFSSNVEESNSTNFSIGNASVVIDILRNRLYENKIRTLTQEYICNARDANREIGQTKPIEITFPTVDNLVLSIRDFGPGVTPDRMVNTFVKYGESTKRHTNTLVGGFGIGSKSAWSYTDSFTITTYIDGTQRIYVAHIYADPSDKTSSKNGRLDLINESSTLEENGTQIDIVINKKDINDFAKAIVRATMFWTEAEYPVFKDHYDHIAYIEDARNIGSTRFMDSNLMGLDHRLFTGTGYYSHIVIDGICYPAPYSAFCDHKISASSLYLTIFVPNGLVQVAASREKIDDSDLSKIAIEQICKAAKISFFKALDEWENSITDLVSLASAPDRSAGFSLSSKKSIDLVKLEHGKLHLRTSRLVDDPNQLDYEGDIRNVTERLFNVHKITYDESSIADFNITNKYEKYYLEKKSHTIKEIMKFLDNNNLGPINLITVVASRDTYLVDKDGDEYNKFKRDENLAKDLIGIIEKLGFKNLVDQLPARSVLTRAPRPKGYKTSGIGYISEYLNNEEKINLADLKKDGLKWIYYVDTKNMKHHFHDLANTLKNLGLIEGGLRVTESNEKHIEDDSQVVEYSLFLKNFVPDYRVAMIHSLNNWHRNYDSDRIISHIKDHLDKNDDLYKIFHKINNNNYNYINSYRLVNVIENSTVYKDIQTELLKLNDYLLKSFSLINYNNYYPNKAELKEYIDWSLLKNPAPNLSSLLQ